MTLGADRLARGEALTAEVFEEWAATEAGQVAQAEGSIPEEVLIQIAETATVRLLFEELTAEDR